MFGKPYKFACHRVNQPIYYVQAKPPQIFLARYYELSWQDLRHLARDLFYLAVISSRAQLELVHLADISFISVRSLLSRRDL